MITQKQQCIPVAACFALLAFLLSIAVIKFLRYTEDDLNKVLHDPRYGRKDSVKKLILLLDGVPYETIAALRNRGYFRIFKRPSKLIVPFPSMTNVAAADLWHTELPEGYESLYFDKEKNSLVGGKKTYFRSRATKVGDYHVLLDYVEPRAYEFIVYGFPRRTNRADMRRFFLSYSASNERLFKAFLKSTDGLVHTGGSQALERSLVELDGVLNKIHRDGGGRLEIILFSDHGNSYNRSKRVDLEGHLKRYGFKVGDHIGGKEGIIIPGFGLVNYAAVYTAPGNKRRVAEAVAELDEVDVVAYQESGFVHVLNKKGQAKIYHKERNNRFKYDALRGDPLEIAGIHEGLRRQGKVLEDGYVADDLLFDSLKDHKYPDAIFRLYKALNGLVKNRADVLVSFKEGYVYGSKVFEIFDRIVTISAFHGGLSASQSQAFFMSTAKEVPPHIRSCDVMKYL